MNDTTKAEQKFYENYRLWPRMVKLLHFVRLLYLGVVSALLGLSVMIVGVWALVQGTSYYQLSARVITLSALLIIVGS